jgi:pyruvate/2-oxoacid:ferredoxin oxidoreductase beta subunit
MTTAATVTPLTSYRNQTPYPFCPGCGHGPILDQLNAALGQLRLDPHDVVLVSDIGCSGLSDQYFDTNAFHGLHGRSLTYASGIKLAQPRLRVIVAMGDGGTGIGGAHLLAAARRNLDLTVLLFNNFNFGMTGGQHSPTTPAGGITATTPGGHLERPIDLCATVAAAGGGFVYRGTSFDDDLAARIADAISYPGFAFVDVWEPCTAHYAPRNRLSRKAIFDLAQHLDFRLGTIVLRQVPATAAVAPLPTTARARSLVTPEAISPCCQAALTAPVSLVLAGSAGGRVGSAARLLARAALYAGLHAAQRTDYPVTVQTGYSLAELVLAPEPIDDVGIERPTALAVLTADGHRQAARYFAAMRPTDTVFQLVDTPPVTTAGHLVALDAATAADPTTGRRPPRDAVATVAAVAMVRRLDLLPAAALLAAAGEHRELAPATRAGIALGESSPAT